MSTLSICMVVKDEEKLLRKCLESVRGIADEIIIIDTGSKDKTMEIAREFTAIAFSFQPKEEYAGAGSESRNESLKHATKDWVLVIDGDEVFDEDSVRELKSLIENQEQIAYTIIQRNYTANIGSAGFTALGKFGFHGYYDNRITRLFKNDKRLFFTSNVHEQIDPSVKKAGGKIIDSGIVIHHLRELKGIEREKQMNYLNAYERKLRENPNDIDTHIGLAIVYQNITGDFGKSLYHFFRALELNPARLDAFVNISYMLMELKRYDEAKRILDKGISHHPANESLLNNLTAYYIRNKDIQKAQAVADKVLQQNPKNLNAMMNRAFILVAARKFEGALECYEDILNLAPSFSEARYNKALLFIKIGRKAEAVAELKKMLEKNPDFAKAKSLLEKIGVSPTSHKLVER